MSLLCFSGRRRVTAPRRPTGPRGAGGCWPSHQSRGSHPARTGWALARAALATSPSRWCCTPGPPRRCRPTARFAGRPPPSSAAGGCGVPVRTQHVDDAAAEPVLQRPPSSRLRAAGHAARRYLHQAPGPDQLLDPPLVVQQLRVPLRVGQDRPHSRLPQPGHRLAQVHEQPVAASPPAGTGPGRPR